MDVRRSYAPPSLIKNIYRGTILMNATFGTATATIPAVNMAKSKVRFLGCLSNGSVSEALATLSLTNSTTVTANRGISSNYSNVSYEVEEAY